MSKNKEQRRANRKEVRTSKALARSVEGHFLKIYFDNAEMKQQVIDFAGLMDIAPGEFMRSAVLRTMIEMTKRANEAKEVYDKEMGVEQGEGTDDTSEPVAGTNETLVKVDGSTGSSTDDNTTDAGLGDDEEFDPEPEEGEAIEFTLD